MTPYPLALERHPTLRQSLLAQVDNCPLGARLSLEFERGWSGHLAGMGIVFHRWAAKALQEMHRQNEERIDPDTAQAILSEVLRQADESEVVAITFEHISDLRWMVVKFANEFRLDLANLVDIEQTLTATVRYPDPAGGFVERRVTGKLDALLIESEGGRPASHAIIPDWKSGWGLPPEKGISEPGYFQQRLYGLLVMENFPSVQRATLRERYVRRGENREAHLTRDQLPQIREDVAALCERFDRMTQVAIEREALREAGVEDVPDPRRAFPASPGAHCSFCTAPGLCPIYRDARGEGLIESPADAERVAGEMETIEAQREQRRKALKAWTSEHGPVRVRHAKDPHRRWGPRPTSQEVKPTREQIAEALAQGQDPAALYRQRPGTRFGAFTDAPAGPPDPADEALARLIRPEGEAA